MGKSKKKKTGVNKHNPTGIQSVSEVEFELTSKGNTVPGALQEIIVKLQSPVDDARECGCTIVAGLVSEPGAIEQLIKHQVVKVLAPLVLDKCQEVRLKALAALRNLSVDGGPSVCEQMVQQDVMTSLVALSKLDGEDFPVEVKQAHHDVGTEIYMQMVHLLLNLCEASSLAVSIFNKEKLWHFLSVPLLSQNTNYPNSLRLAAAQCLYTVSEDNPELANTSLKDSLKQTITAPTTSPDTSSELVFLRMLSMGILVNLVGNQVSADSGELVAMVTSLAEVLGIDVVAMLFQNDSEASELNKERLEEIQNLLSAQKVALEVVANLCCSDGDGWEDVSSSESSCDDITDEVINDVTTEEPMEASSNGEVLNLAQPLTEEQPQSIEALSSGQKLVNSFSSRQTHALLCLNNLFGSLGKEAFEDANKLDTVWQGLVTLSKDKKSIENQELLEAITSAMRALIQILTEAEPSKFSDISASDLQYMLEMALKCSWREVRVNSLRIVATIGTVLAKSLQPHPLLKDIGMFLLEVVCKDSDLWVVAEALDSIFDVFGEDHVDPVVQEIGMVDKLKTIAPVLKSKGISMNYSPTFYAKIRNYLLTSTDSRLHDHERRSSGPNFWMHTVSQGPENNYDEVYPGIFMGDYTLAMNKAALLELGISHLVNCSQGSGSKETNTDARFYRSENIKYLGIKALDIPTYNMMAHFKDASEFIDKALKKGGRVFVHCYKGVSRSATIVIAYLMLKCNIDLEEAVKIVRAKRKIHPNDGFIRQLCILSRQLYGAKFE